MLWKVKYAFIRLASGAPSAHQDRLSDELYARLRYILHFERLPRFRNPRSFYERMNALKLYDREPAPRTDRRQAGRARVRTGAGRRQISDPALPGVGERRTSVVRGITRQFVMKANHGSGMVKVVTDRDIENVGAVRRLCEAWLGTNYAAREKEWVYRDIPRRVFAEEYLTDGRSFVPLDYRFFVLFGRCGLIQVDRGRFSDHHTRAVFDRDFNELPHWFGHPHAEGLVKPGNLDEMVSIAETLWSRVLPQLNEGLDMLPNSLWREARVRSGAAASSRTV